MDALLPSKVCIYIILILFIIFIIVYNIVSYTILVNNNNNISLLQTHGPYTYKKNVKHI